MQQHTGARMQVWQQKYAHLLVEEANWQPAAAVKPAQPEKRTNTHTPTAHGVNDLQDRPLIEY
jgi:hypothetical protein